MGRRTTQSGRTRCFDCGLARWPRFDDVVAGKAVFPGYTDFCICGKPDVHSSTPATSRYCERADYSCISDAEWLPDDIPYACPSFAQPYSIPYIAGVVFGVVDGSNVDRTSRATGVCDGLGQLTESSLRADVLSDGPDGNTFSPETGDMFPSCVDDPDEGSLRGMILFTRLQDEVGVATSQQGVWEPLTRQCLATQGSTITPNVEEPDKIRAKSKGILLDLQCMNFEGAVGDTCVWAVYNSIGIPSSMSAQQCCNTGKLVEAGRGHHIQYEPVLCFALSLRAVMQLWDPGGICRKALALLLQQRGDGFLIFASAVVHVGVQTFVAASGLLDNIKANVQINDGMPDYDIDF